MNEERLRVPDVRQADREHGEERHRHQDESDLRGGVDVGLSISDGAARSASEAIKSVSAELECGPLGNLGRPGNLVARLEQEPAKSDLARGRGDRGGVAKVHEASR